MPFDYNTCNFIAPYPFVFQAACLLYANTVTPLSSNDLIKPLTLGEIGAARCSSFWDYSDELVILVGVTGILKAGAGVDGRSLDIFVRRGIVDIPECHWEAAALLAVGSIWCRDFLLSG